MAINNTGVTMLSILIPSIPERGGLLSKLLEEIEEQGKNCFPELGCIEVITDDSAPFLNGGPSIGMKRQNLLIEATGKYLCYLDDDENISPNYIETLLRLCAEDRDICTFMALFKLQYYWGIIDMRLVYKSNEQTCPDYIIRRRPWHMCPVRREFAQLYSFKDINNAEDFDWFEQVLSHCTTEAHTDRILFQYNHSGKNSEADKITNHGN